MVIVRLLDKGLLDVNLQCSDTGRISGNRRVGHTDANQRQLDDVSYRHYNNRFRSTLHQLKRKKTKILFKQFNVNETVHVILLEGASHI